MDALVWAPRQMTWVDGSLPITMNVRTGPGENWFLVEMEGYSSLYWLYR
ncbi:MAG: hypothetical protein OXF55_10470 [Caldilineaceae bacterium]|nr:hypothetical protein [Caldilineaceae bacterium]MDE0180664.1 hypothetical protein [Caldilineaceae bacterium]